MKIFAMVTALALSTLTAAPVVAQEADGRTQEEEGLQDFRPYDQRGLNVFEPWLVDTEDVPYEGFRLFWGASFTQQFQALDHSNEALPVVVDGVDQNELIDIGWGFNLATANLYLGAQLADGIRVHLETFLSSRHHPEAWVKGGYLLVDELPMLRSALIDRVMDNVNLRIGHFEINYGDAHFRRTDNANAMHNPFVGNLIMDAYTTEIGGEVYLETDAGLLAMAAITGGEIRGAVERPDDRSPSFYGKLGFDRRLSEDVRVRLTGSAYTTSASLSNTLHGGDRAGSRYYFVMENTQANLSRQFTSGRFNPGFRDEVTAFMINPFVRFGGLELFGTWETVEGRSAGETADRSADQWAGEVLYRFLDESAYVGGRYNTVDGELAGSLADVTIDRFQLAGGWFLTPNVLLKAEWVNQEYDGFPEADIRRGGDFDGFLIEGVISF